MANKRICQVHEELVPRSAAEQSALRSAIRALRDLERFGLATEPLHREFVRILHDPSISNLSPVLRESLMQVARDAENVRLPEDEGKQLSGAARKVAYQSKIFRCLSDYEKCCSGHTTVACGSLLVVCIAQQLVPFAPKG